MEKDKDKTIAKLVKKNEHLIKEITSLKSQLFHERDKNMVLEMKLYNHNPEYFKKDRVTNKEIMQHSCKTRKVIPFPTNE